MENNRSEIIDNTHYDSVVMSILNQFKSRAQFGKKKYGTDLDRTDLTTVQWIQHAIEEHMDAILYLEKLRQIEMEKEKEKDKSTLN